MSRPVERIFGVFVPLAAVIALIALLMFTLTRLAQIQQDMRINVSANMLWVITQTQVKGLRLSSILQQHLREGGKIEEGTQAYRLLTSRFSLLSAGPQMRYLESLDGGKDFLESIQHVRDSAATVSLKGADDEAAMTGLLGALADLDTRLASIAGKTMVTQWEEMGSRLDRYRNGVLTIIFLMLGICACSFVISVHMFIALRRVRESEWAKRQALQLQSQLDAARQVSELHRNFGAMVSHQFRTPLAIIDASMQRILRAGDRIDWAQLEHRVQKVRRATARLARLVEQTRIGDKYSELLEVSCQSSALVPLIDSIAQQQREIAPHRAIEFLPSHDALPDAWCDPVLVEHIVFNLLSNAIKYSPADTGIQISVFQEHDRICCEVRDLGVGVTQYDLPHVFDRYFRGRGVADIPGTGMGLYVAHTLTKMQNGILSARPNPEGGSIFKVCFPVANTQNLEHRDATRRES